MAQVRARGREVTNMVQVRAKERTNMDVVDMVQARAKEREARRCISTLSLVQKEAKKENLFQKSTKEKCLLSKKLHTTVAVLVQNHAPMETLNTHALSVVLKTMMASVYENTLS